MIPVAIFLFLVGAVLAWGFRVWILVPLTLLAIIVPVAVGLSTGAGLLAACGYGLLCGLAPQLGYAFGLFARHVLLMMRSPRNSRDASVALLYKRALAERSR